jgi:hypothetical protein
MEFHDLPALALPLLVQDILVAIGAGVALLAILVFLNLGLLLPGVLTALGGPQPDQRGAYLEFGPAAGPLISEPAPPGAMDPEANLEPTPVARPHLWGPALGARARI